MRVHLLFFLLVVFAGISTPVFACKCVSPPPEVKTARDLAQWYADRSDAIFEGTVKRVEVNWALMNTKIGGLVAADLDQDEPTLQVTFDVSRFYKGVEKKELSLTTGVGGGDCGFDFEVGTQYLVYASADSPGRLSTGICSGTGLLEYSQSARSYLRGEQAATETVKQNKRISPTKLCGHVESAGTDLTSSQLFLFRVGNKSPIPTEESEVTPDGSFCIEGARPGSYYLAFLNRDDDSPTSYAFFPGTINSSEASTVELRSGESHSGLKFRVPPQPKFSVSGSVLIPDKRVLPECKVFLMSIDPLSFLVSYSTDLGPTGHFDFPRVLPGKYWAFVGINSDSCGWRIPQVP